MKQFKVGDLVRIIWAPYYPEHVGKITTVTTGLVTMRSGRLGHQLDLFDADGTPFAGAPDQLEPFWPGKEASDKTLAEILSSIRSKSTEDA